MPAVQGVTAPASAVQHCPKLLPVKAPCNLKCLLDSASETSQAYNKCRTGHDALIDFVQK